MTILIFVLIVLLIGTLTKVFSYLRSGAVSKRYDAAKEEEPYNVLKDETPYFSFSDNKPINYKIETQLPPAEKTEVPEDVASFFAEVTKTINDNVADNKIELAKEEANPNSKELESDEGVYSYNEIPLPEEPPEVYDFIKEQDFELSELHIAEKNNVDNKKSKGNEEELELPMQLTIDHFIDEESSDRNKEVSLMDLNDELVEGNSEVIEEDFNIEEDIMYITGRVIGTEQGFSHVLNLETNRRIWVNTYGELLPKDEISLVLHKEGDYYFLKDWSIL
ncbi:hypothetical protein [Bacillus mycoides]|uniref:hypothetical protein n=1 Tax=Bacillus mycoides TaxID=1405 RepID=UPI0010BE6698|nr:hypothetical protein [Bacillus mycoides]TKI39975.1 hypothetical protein FC700_20905 [Bacillus mycoides]